MDPHNDTAAWSKKAVDYWREVDLYLGGAEHAVGHLLYSRFWHKVFFDMGLVPTPEPFKKLVHQGLMQGEDGEKMSKSRGNVVNPDDIIAEHGADSFRLYEMFMGPLEKAKPWQSKGIEGVSRFLSRYLRFALAENGQLSPRWKDIPQSEWPKPLVLVFHRTIRQIGEDIEKLSFNTAISSLMILMNEYSDAYGQAEACPKEFLETFTVLLHPFAPHLTEEVWEKLGHRESLVRHAWPTFDAAKTVAEEIQLAIQVNGKVRDQIKVAAAITEAELKERVLALESVQRWMEGKTLKKFVYVKGRLASVVV